MLPMPSDFAIRLAGGLAHAPARHVPSRGAARLLPHHRTGDAGPARGSRPGGRGRGAPGYVGHDRRGRRAGVPVLGPLGPGLAAAGPARSPPASRSPRPALLAWAAFSKGSTANTGLEAFNAASRLASALLMGSTLAAMLLGHHYLTAPAMSIDPLKRYVLAMAIALPVAGFAGGRGPGPLLAVRQSRRARRPAVPRDAVGDGHARAGGGDVHDLADREDPLYPVGNGHPLHRHDPGLVRRACRADPGTRRGGRALGCRRLLS